MANMRELSLQYASPAIEEHLLDRARLRDFLDLFPFDPGPTIVDFQPWQGYAGTIMVIAGNGFSAERRENQVKVAGESALVVEATVDRLVVITSHLTRTGPVEVTVDGDVAVGPRDFQVLPWPKPASGDDGPPYSYAGVGPGSAPSAGTVPPTGTAKIMVVACYPTDKVPADLAATRQDIVDTFAEVTTYYDQASYSALDVQVDVTTFVPLLGNADYYHRANGAAGYPNIDGAVLDQLMAECAQGAVDQGFDLDDYSVLVASIHLPGLSVRAWGGWSSSNFAYDDGAGTTINIVTSHPLGLIAQRHDADWGRAAHEFGHNLVDGGLVLGEDVYGSDLVDPGSATVQNFDLMGNHDSHPLFSAFWIHQLGWYAVANVRQLAWDRNPFSQEFDLVAHGLTQDADPNRVHVLRIKVADGLYYFVEVRQRPDTTGTDPQVFDGNIPLPMGGTPDGGVLVSRAIVGELNNNQQTRLVTLLQAQERVMITGETAVDPLRTLRITVVNDSIQARPRVCRVRVEWAQEIAETPGGDFDLRLEPWGPGWETVDIWIDRNPFGPFDHSDASGNPTGNGDKPRPLEINRFEARVRNDGTADAANVLVTHYAVEPPGVGDNGNWSPLLTYSLPNVPAGGSVVGRVNWVPLVGEHTCLKVAVSQQLGEVTGGNNSAQENVFEFEPAASSVPDPVSMTVAVRNPLKERSLVHIGLEGVPFGYYVYFPHRWLWLDPLAERKLDLLVIPWIDFRENKHRTADVRLYGRVPRVYEEPLDITGNPASWLAPIGGINAQVTPKHRGKIRLDRKAKRQGGEQVAVTGTVEPNIADQQVRVDMTRPDGKIQVEAAYTDVAGRFSATFDLGRKGQRGSKEKAQTMAPGTYAFQAHVMGATRIAPTDSNVVFIQIGGKPSEERARVREEYRTIDLEEALRPDKRRAAAPEEVTAEEVESTKTTS
jgi:M6 family metalloprotease-like protein